jgi:tRNA A37 threonylcarbamoyladenosine dehydratase
MLGPFTRTEILLGQEALQKLNSSTVAIFGIGGVGGYAAEALARSGVGRLVLIDNDDVSLTNINRQIIATTKTVGCAKVDVMRDRIMEINPEAQVVVHKTFYTPQNAEEEFNWDYTYVVDAIDTISAKIDLAVRCNEKKIPIMSSMGAGNKLDPTRFEVADIYKTSIDPIAKVMRYELRKREIKNLKVVYSKEVPLKIDDQAEASRMTRLEAESSGSKRRSIPGSIAFVPSVAGLIIAGEVIKDITGINNSEEEK